MRTVAMLLAGRGMARLSQYLAGFILLAIWGPVTFAGYAAAVGVGAWVYVLLAVGIERAALVLVEEDDRRLEPLFAALGLAPFALTLLGWLGLALVLPGHQAVTYAAGLAYMAGMGGITVLVGLARLRGRPGADAAAFAALSAGYLLVVLLGTVGGVGVDGVLGALAVILLVLNVALLGWLRLGTRIVVHRADLVLALRTIGLLATGDVVGGIVGSTLYAFLVAWSPPEQASIYYACSVLSVACGVLVVYLMRLWQRDLLRWLAGNAALARLRLRRWLSGTSLVGAVLCAASTLLVIHWGGTVRAAILAVIVETALYVAVLGAAFIVESIDERSRLHSATSAVVSMLLVALLAWPLVPAAGAAGAFIALAIGWLVRGMLLLRATRPPPATPAAAPLNSPCSGRAEAASGPPAG